MTHAVFIRTYSGDLDWLVYCLKSIVKYLSGYNELIVAIPEKELHHLDGFGLTNVRVVGVHAMKDDYVGQQITKLSAHHYTNADVITFIDSDTIFTMPTILTDFMQDGKLIIYKTRYTSIDSPWQSITQRSIGFPVEWEYMRRFPLSYYNSTLAGCEQHIKAIHNMDLKKFGNTRPFRSLSEFNMLGAYAEMYQSNLYSFIDTEAAPLPQARVRQFWSWGGITDEVKKEIDLYL
jgi:hypothetical protein